MLVYDVTNRASFESVERKLDFGNRGHRRNRMPGHADIASGLLQNDVLQDYYVISNNFIGELKFGCRSKLEKIDSFSVVD